MRIVTWNVNSLKARLPRVLEFLALHAPDVVCLQETKANPEAFPEAELAAAGYHAVHHSGGRWAGVAILARDELALADPILGLEGDPMPEEARWCEATVDGIRFVSTYVPNGRSLDSPEFPRKLAFLDAMGRRIARLGEFDPTGTLAPTGPLAPGGLIVAGDMNIAPNDLDVYDPAAFAGGTHVSDTERDRLQQILTDGELVDAHRSVRPDTVQYTWWDYRAGHFHKGLGLRIDLVLVSRAGGLAGRLAACRIERDFRKGHKPSDHVPLVVELR